MNFQASIILSPILLNFEIIGISEEGVLFESNCNFKEQSVIYFNCRSFLDAIGLEEKDYSLKIIKSKN